MPVVYIDNFRGFENTFIQLRKMNFLVGENSTGKTSILKLIKILSDSRFWFMENFSSEDANLGHFNEIISKSSKNRKNFKIGILGDETDYSKSLTAILMKFVDEGGRPVINEVNMILHNVNIHSMISNDSLKYRYRKIDLENVDESNKLRYFKWWVKNNPLKGYRYSNMKDNQKYKYPSNLMNIYSTLVDKVLELNEDFSTEGLAPVPRFLNNITWMAPIRAEPQRTYDSYETNYSPEGKHSPYLLKQYYDNRNINSKIFNKLEDFGINSGLFEKIDINVLGKNIKTAPFEIHINLNGTSYKLPNVGYGISQILPIIVEIAASKDQSWFSLQQPEIHIHPKAQAAFGEFVFNSIVYNNKSFIIETHSDFIIDRFRYMVHQNKDSTVDEFGAQVVFFQRTNKGNKLQCIPILNSGKYSEKQPDKFREFFINEDLNTIQI